MKVFKPLLLLLCSQLLFLNLFAQTTCSSSDFRILDNSSINLSCNKLNTSLTGQIRNSISSYQWTTLDGYIISGAEDLFPQIGSAGTYYLQVVGKDGCRGVDSVLVIADPLRPDLQINATSTNFNCTVSQIQLTAISTSTITNYQWTSPDGNVMNSDTSATITIDKEGIYILIVTTPEGCVSSQQIVITKEVAPQASITTLNTQLLCNSSQLQLDATTSIGASTYQWTTSDGNILTGSNTATPIITKVGTYLLTVLSKSGCSDTEEITITEDVNIPIIQVEDIRLITCQQPQIELDASQSKNVFTYEWISIGGNIVSGSTTSKIIVNQPGIYQVKATSTSGCTQMDEVIVGIDVNVPTAIIETPPTFTCENTIVELNALNSEKAISYDWTTMDGTIVSGSNTPLPIVSSAGTYTLVVTGINGCTNSATVTVSHNNDPPQINLLPTSSLTCNQKTLLIDASNSIGGTQYKWTTLTGTILFGEDTPIITVNQPGEYTLTLSNENGCSSKETVIVDEVIEKVFENLNFNICQGNTIVVGGTTYNTSGTFVDTLTSINGCDSIVTINLNINQRIVTNESVSLCPGEAYVINGNTYNQAGNYTEAFINRGSNGCDSIVNFEIKTLASSEATIERFICGDTPITINGIDFTEPGTYNILIENSTVNGCDSIVFLTVVPLSTTVAIVPPEDITIDCNASLNLPSLSITNREQVIDIKESESIVSQDACTTVVQRDWVVMDVCGQQLTAQQKITKLDKASPVFQIFPDTTVFECGMEDFLPPPFVTDDCGFEVNLRMEELKVGIDSCAYQVNRQWIAEDNCGNISVLTRTITVIDKTGPNIIFNTSGFDDYTNGDTLHFACGAAPVLDISSAIAIDNCDENPQLFFIENIEDYDACSVLMYCGWRGVDACGNVNEVGFYFHITDEEAPVFDNYPPNITVADLKNAPTADTLHATDNCTQHIHVYYEETREETECYDRIVRSWTAQDDCGHQESYFQYISAPNETDEITCAVVKILLRAGLQGAMTTNTPLMRDDLRISGLIPTEEPYTTHSRFQVVNGGGETTSTAVLEIEGTDAIVDWVFLELRDATYQVVATRSALLQRDGDIVDVDGKSPVRFDINEGKYYIAIRHRNHLGTMSLEPYFLTSTTDEVIDFCSTDFPTYGENAQILSDIGYTLRAGNTNADGTLIFSGVGNDRDPIFFDILNNSENINTVYNFILNGYHQCDTNMDGQVIYQGNANDIDQAIFFNILLHPDNINQYMNFIVEEQLPRKE